MKKEDKEKRKQEKALTAVLNSYKYRRMIKVNDNWSPNFPNNEVCISTSISWFNCFKNKGEVIQSVYGMDDLSVERRFQSNEPDELIKQWNIWKEFAEKVPQVTNKKWFLDRGFVYG